MDGLDSLVRRAQRGDERAFHELFVRHRNDVARIVLRTLGPEAELEDIVQEAFVQIFRSLRHFRGTAKFSTWLYRVVSNVARMHVRKRRARPRLAFDDPTHGAASDAAEAPDEELERKKRLRALYGHLDALSDKKRAVLVLHDFEGLSPTEIAEILETNAVTVRTRLFYARRELYAALAADPRLRELTFELREASAGALPNKAKVTP